MEIVEKSKLPAFGKTTYVADIDGAGTTTLRTFYTAIAKSLRFPDYFDRNLDALYDCLTSMDDIKEPEVVLIIKNAKQFLEKEKPAVKKDVLSTFTDAQMPENRYDEKTFRVFGLK